MTKMKREELDPVARRSDFMLVLGEMRESFREVRITLARLTGEVAEIKQNSATKAELRDLRSEMLSRMDLFAGSLNDFRRQWAYQSDAIFQHERRLGKLESNE